MPPHVLRERLFAAEERIAELEEELASRPALTAKQMTSDGQLKLIAELQKRVQELELVCEAQAEAPPMQIREDVEREWAGRVAALEAQLEKKNAFAQKLSEQCDYLTKVSP